MEFSAGVKFGNNATILPYLFGIKKFVIKH